METSKMSLNTLVSKEDKNTIQWWVEDFNNVTFKEGPTKTRQLGGLAQNPWPILLDNDS